MNKLLKAWNYLNVRLKDPSTHASVGGGGISYSGSTTGLGGGVGILGQGSNGTAGGISTCGTPGSGGFNKQYGGGGGYSRESCGSGGNGGNDWNIACNGIMTIDRETSTAIIRPE